MADWKRLARNLALTNGSIDRRESDIIRAEIVTGGRIDRSEAEFLIDLRKTVKHADASFHRLVLDVVKQAVLSDGTISPDEAKWLKAFLFADGVLDALEMDLLRELQESAVSTCPEFDELMHRYVSI